MLTQTKKQFEGHLVLLIRMFFKWKWPTRQKSWQYTKIFKNIMSCSEDNDENGKLAIVRAFHNAK